MTGARTRLWFNAIERQKEKKKARVAGEGKGVILMMGLAM